MFAAYPLWWVLGLGSIAWIPLAFLMLILLLRSGHVEVPRGFGIWLAFLLLMVVSVVGIDSPGRYLGYLYRVLQYLSVTVVLVYVYNARVRLSVRHVLGLVTLFWLWAVIGGYASILFPAFSFRTPLGILLPAGLQNNEVVGEMVVRRLTQHNPDSWIAMDPRPSAPFLYTNQWGTVYSLCLSMVVAYMSLIRRGPTFWLLTLAAVASLVPALLTLNRGMFIGLGVAAAYLLWRFAWVGRWRAVAAFGLGGIAVFLATSALGVAHRLTERVGASSSTEDRADLYAETFQRTLQSPLFGYGAPRPSMTEGAPSAGTQGHLWTVMFSYGFPALLCFVAALLWMAASTYRTAGNVGLLLHSVTLVIIVEMLYYGVLPNGLMLAFIATALLMREQLYVDPPDVQRRPHTSV
ncbi:MAG: O-antigen ligase family protein [Galactobacter sp.]